MGLHQLKRASPGDNMDFGPVWQLGGEIDPYFVENDVTKAVTVNIERYRTIITNFFI